MPPESEFNLNAEFIAEAAVGEVIQGRGIDAPLGAVTDSRQAGPGQFFVALQGEHADGHAYIKDALEQGVTGVVLAQERVNEFKDLLAQYGHRVFAVAVKNPLAALQDTAAAWLKLIGTQVIGVTGSVGKTTTKGLIANGLNGFGATYATPGNFNNHIGLAISVLGIRPYNRWAVLEYGTSGFGEIRFLTGIARPHVAVVTEVAGSHLAHFRDLDGVARAKAELVQALDRSGIAVLNADNPRVMAMKEYAQHYLTFGRKEGVDVRIVDVAITKELRTACTLEVRGHRMNTELNVLGLHQVNNLAAAACTALGLGLDMEKFLQGASGYQGDKHRMAVLRTQRGIVVDDSYNASLKSIKAALNTLQAIGRPMVVILGDVKELGDAAQQVHAGIGRAVADSHAALFIALGDDMKVALQAAQAQGMDKRSLYHAIDAKQAIEMAMSLGPEDPIVLVKGSRAMRMELVANNLAALWNTEHRQDMEH